MPTRLRLARLVCRPLPPVIAAHVSDRIYPPERGFSDRVPVSARGRTGSVFTGNTRDLHASVFAIHGYFDWRLVAVASFLCRKGDTIVEVGANVGTETLAFADIVGRAGHVHAFEPFPGNLAQLREVIHRALLTQVEIIPAAVADVPGYLEFSPPPDGWSGSGHLAVDAPLHGPRDTIKVETTTLDAHFKSTAGKVHFLSIDAEGAETTILGGAAALIARDHPVIVVEAEPALLRTFGTSLSELKAKLESFGYRVFTIGRFGLHEPETDSDRNWNWVALPPSRVAEAGALSRYLFQCAVLPWVPLLHPMAR
jgi:FkbM family methyltransferase